MDKATRTNHNHHPPSSFRWNKSIVNDLIDAQGVYLILGAKRERLIDILKKLNFDVRLLTWIFTLNKNVINAQTLVNQSIN